MTGNRAVVFNGTGKVDVETIAYPELMVKDGPGVAARNVGRKCEHGVILKVISTNICGSDQHMVHGRTTAPSGLVLGHEITGEVIEVGRDVEFIKKGDFVSVPFNVACGRCRSCKERDTHVCLNVNEKPGGAYGYVDMGGWVGGQAEYVMVPYADFQLLRFPDKDQALEKILDLTMLSDIFPTGYHGAYSAGVTTGSTVYVAGAGPVGLAAAHSAQLLGAAVVIVGDMNKRRLEQARSFGCETVDLSEHDNIAEQIEQILGVPEVDCAIDCVGYEAHGHGPHDHTEGASEQVLDSIMTVSRAGGQLGIPGVYMPKDPGAKSEEEKKGIIPFQFGLGWSKALSFVTGQAPVMRYHRELMNAILSGRAQIAKAVNATVIDLEDAPHGYSDFDQGVAQKFVLDPHGILRKTHPEHVKRFSESQ